MREALKNKEGRSRISTQDRKIASAVIRKARRKTKAKSPKKQTGLETTEETEANKEQEKLPESEVKETDISSMPVLEEEGPCKVLMEEKTEDSDSFSCSLFATVSSVVSSSVCFFGLFALVFLLAFLITALAIFRS